MFLLILPSSPLSPIQFFLLKKLDFTVVLPSRGKYKECHTTFCKCAIFLSKAWSGAQYSVISFLLMICLLLLLLEITNG